MNIIHQNATKKHGDIFYNVIFLVWIIIITLDYLPRMGHLPLSSFNPTGFLLKFWPMSVKAAILTPGFLTVFKIVTIVSLCCVYVKPLRKPASVIACLLLTIHQGIARGFGHVGHTEIIFLYCAYLLTAFSFANDSLKKNNGDDCNIDIHGIPFVFLFVLFCYTYCFPGLHRLFAGGWGLYASDNIIYWIVENANIARYHSFHLDGLVLEHVWLQYILKWGFFLSTIVEVLAPLCLISRKFRIFFIIFMIPFHFIIWLFMGIFFWQNLMLFFLFFDFSKRQLK